MNNPEIDIYKFLKRNRIITISSVVACLVIVGLSMLFSYKTYVYSMNNTLTIDKNGEVLPMKFVDRDQNIDVEIKNHLSMWFDAYYNYDKESLKDNKRRASYLISQKDFKALETFYNSHNWFDNVAKYYLKVNGDIKNVDVSGKKEPYRFQGTGVIEINRGLVSDFYEMQITGNTVLVKRSWPYNPHGMVIYNYKESTLVKTKTETHEHR